MTQKDETASQTLYKRELLNGFLIRKVFDCWPSQHFLQISLPMKTSDQGLREDWAATSIQPLRLMKCGIYSKQHRTDCLYLPFKSS
ncbi:hypothetical protein TNCV_3550321 [Trichonephila clavipes]|nr:hypothetical protein TNCV_3550321 [Trichonephila clavipes]